MSLLQRPKGTADITPADSTTWQWLATTAQQVFGQAGYTEIRPPIFEYTELFVRGVGEETDIVGKEMYTFEQGDRSLTLRPELTAGTIRAYIENGMTRLPKPVRLYYFGPAFRYERPQAGRQRQFHQVGIEHLGPQSPQADAEVILLAMAYLQALGLTDLTLLINNLGDPEDRVAFKAQLKQQLAGHLHVLCDDCQRRYDTNPLRMLDCKNPTCQAIYQAPELQQFLATDFSNPEAQEHFQALCAILTTCGVSYTVSPMLVRGLDYYSRTVFEITSTQLGAQNTVCGGGRYNHLVEQLGGEPTHAVGFAMGLERLIRLLPAPPQPQPVWAVVLCLLDTPTAWAHALQLAQELRQSSGKIVHVDISTKNAGKRIAQAAKLGAAYALLLGETELATHTVQVKAMASQQQQTIPQDQLNAILLGAILRT